MVDIGVNVCISRVIPGGDNMVCSTAGSNRK